MVQLTLVLPILLACTGSAIANLTVLYEWNYIDYGWLSPYDKEWAIDFGQYLPTRITINDIQPIPYNRLLVTTPKVWDNPASLSYISFRTGDAGSLLAPYPNWSYHKEAGDCSGITSASKVKLDACDRLWVVDSGKIRDEKLCPPRLFVFDARTDDLLLKVPIPEELAHSPDDPNKGRLQIEAVETKGDECQDTMAYISDLEGWGLIAFDGCSFWRLNDQVYAPDEGATVFKINGDNVTLDVGLSTTIIPPAGFIEEDTLIFKPLASDYVYGASLQDIRDSRSEGKVTYYKSNTILPSQGLASDISSQGVIISGFEGSLACWNVQSSLEDPNVVFFEQNPDFSFVSGLKIYDEYKTGPSGEHFWVATTKLNTYLKDNLDVTEVNFRILKGNVADLVQGTLCEPEQHDAVKTLEDLFFSKYEE